MIITEEKLRGIIREEILKEAALDTFSLEKLDSIMGYRDRIKYCNSQLGKEVGRGSSRIVYQVDDFKVLKLALNEKGVAQNEEEGRDDYMKDRWGVFPKVYYKADDYSWLVCEYVIPARAVDFYKCFGMKSFKEFVSFVARCWDEGHGGHHYNAMDLKRYRYYCDKDEYLENMCEYIQCYDVVYGDLSRLSSYGLAMREGRPVIVILDSGLSNYVWDTYYSRY